MEKEDKGLKMANGNEEMVGDQGGSPRSERYDNVYDRMREDADIILLSDDEAAYSLAAQAGLGGEPKDGADGTAAKKSPNAVWSLVEKQPPSGRNRARRVPPRANSSKNNGVLGVAGTPNFVAPHRNWKNSRRSRNLHGRGLPKKGGAGGKGVWGKPGAEVFDELDDEDPNDPNFDIDAYNSSHNVELKEVVPAPPPVVELTEEEIIKKMESILLEYYENGDTDEAADGLERILSTERKPLVIKTIVGVAFDHKQSQREMTSVLISDLYGRVVTRDDICAGFDQLLYELPDIMLDTPDAPHLLGNFIARAIADDCVPPKYAYESEREDLDNHARSALVRASALLSMPGGWSKLDNVWGVGGALRPVQTITHQMALLLQEYVVSREIEEAQRSIKELEVPHFHHELIYEAIILTLEAFNESIEEAICHLFRTLDSTCIVSPEQMEIGFRRVYDDMTDIVLDIPLAYSILDRFIQRCRRAGSFLSESLIKDLPTRGRKRFVSEGDGGLVKQVNFLNNM